MSSHQSGQIAKPAPSPLSRIEGQYKSALNVRWLSLVARSAVLSTTVITLIVSLRAGPTIQASIFSLIAAIAVYPFAIYPILAARKDILVSPTPAPLRASVFSLTSSSVLSSQGMRYITTHLASGAILSAVYAIVINIAQPSTELGCLAVTPRHPFHLNERFLFLILGNAGMMVTLATWDLLARRLRITWPSRNIPLGVAVQDGLTTSMPWSPGETSSLSIATVWLAVYPGLYFLLGKSIWVSLVTYIGVLRPFVINFTKPSRSLGVSIIPHLLALEVMTILAARLPPIQAIVPYLSVPLSFEGLRRKSPFTPEQHIVIALQSKNPYHLQFTLMELLRISNNPKLRQTLFSSTSKSQPPILAIWEQLLLHLGNAHQKLVSRGGTRTASSAAPSRPTPIQDSHTVQVKQANILRSAPPPKSSGFTSAIQSALEGPVQATPPALLSKAQGLALEAKGRAETKAVEWSGEVMGRVEKSDVGGTVLKEARGIWAGIGDWTGGEWADRQISGSLPEVKVIERIMDIFAALACASLQEDTYGYVQKVLPATLELIVRHRSALISLESELIYNAATLSRGTDKAKRDIQARLAIPISACENSIQRIADAFGESLSAFRFPSAIGSSLAGICQVRSEAQPS